MRIWVDITNTPHVHFLHPIIRHLGQKHEVFVTARDFSETIPLLMAKGLNPIVLGDHKGKSKLKKAMGLVSRVFLLHKTIPEFDVSISIGGQIASLVAYLRRKQSIVFTDNDISYKFHVYKIAKYFIFPAFFDVKNVLLKAKGSARVFQYDGFKEQIYLADFKPDPSFLESLPFDEFLVLRPENLKASYVPANTRSIVPELLHSLQDHHILYLPRYPEERKQANGYANVYMPDQQISGLDACYYSQAVLTGAGTFAREAALLGKPSVSFFPGVRLLSVDKVMVEQGLMFHSRSLEDIVDYINNPPKLRDIASGNDKVQAEVFTMLDNILGEID